ncbi:hypothetical protein [Streptomyces sp. NPDC008121]|uniref:hypothetical protein n=1 Tax=Streptomyces sp. NPDC008121 TaxID=3364809 RepID=UPI0036E75A12
MAGERASVSPAPGQVAGRAVMLVPHREPEIQKAITPPDCQRNLTVVRRADGPVTARQVGETLGVDVT